MEKESFFKGAARRLLGGALAFALALNIFAVTGLEANAAETKYTYIKLDSNATVNDVYTQALQGNSSLRIISELVWPQSAKDIVDQWYKDTDVKVGSILITGFRKQDNEGYKFDYYEKNNNTTTTYGVTSHLIDDFVSGKKDIYIVQIDSSVESSSASDQTSPDQGNPIYSHAHSFEWTVTKEPTKTQDGLEEYRCECGAVEASQPISMYMAIVKGLYGAVKDAPQNGTATFDTGSAITMTDYVIGKLAERSDVTTVVTFEYQGLAYRMTIPAGADYTGLLADEEYFYGYFYFADVVGATIETL